MKLLKSIKRVSLKRLVAFTLAEVLITLGIIGVVAAMTLPTLIHNYQKKTYVEGLKVGMSIFEQAFKKAMADDGVTDFRDTELFKACDGNAFSDNEQWAESCHPLLKKYFIDVKFESVGAMQAQGDTTNITTDTAKCKQLVGKTNKWWRLYNKTQCRGWKNMAMTLANGMRADVLLADYDFFAGSLTALDINGSKGPNTWGRDVFNLRILNSGNVVPNWGEQYIKVRSEYKNEDYETALRTYSWRYNNDKCSTTSSSDSENELSCAARIIEEGWKMNY